MLYFLHSIIKINDNVTRSQNRKKNYFLLKKYFCEKEKHRIKCDKFLFFSSVYNYKKIIKVVFVLFLNSFL